jgi:hypothetical protein
MFGSVCQFLQWVKTGNPQTEQNFSAVPWKADVTRTAPEYTETRCVNGWVGISNLSGLCAPEYPLASFLCKPSKSGGAADLRLV